jgi:hypothetical protein
LLYFSGSVPVLFIIIIIAFFFFLFLLACLFLCCFCCCFASFIYVPWLIQCLFGLYVVFVFDGLRDFGLIFWVVILV